MNVIDWRREPAAIVKPLLDAECEWWRVTLGWDLVSSWAPVEPARTAGDLPGFLAIDDEGAVDGWAFFLRHRSALHVGSFVAYSRAATSALLEAMIDAPEAREAKQVIAFTRLQAPGLVAALMSRGFEVEPYYHLDAATPREPFWPPGVRTWTPDDLRLTIDVIARAYQRSRELRPFVPEGHADDWASYIAGIISASGCGRFLDWASIVAPGAAGGVEGVVLTTAVSKRTAHIAQIAVDPAEQGRGLGKMLMRAAGDAVRARGFERMTLFVAGRNRRASALYRALGFRRTASFVTAVRRQPRSSTRVAPEAAGASTLR